MLIKKEHWFGSCFVYLGNSSTQKQVIYLIFNTVGSPEHLDYQKDVRLIQDVNPLIQILDTNLSFAKDLALLYYGTSSDILFHIRGL